MVSLHLRVCRTAVLQASRLPLSCASRLGMEEAGGGA